MSAVQPLPQKHRLTVDDYYRMADVGILPPGSRVELVEGEIIDLVPIGSRHAGHVARFTQIFAEACGKRAVVWVQNPIRLSKFSEPQPDLALLKLRDDFYASAHPGPRDVLLVIEVADTTLPYDRGVKAPLYARYGVPEYWIVDVDGRQVIRHLQPEGDAYRNVSAIAPLDRVTLSRLAGCTVDLRELF